ncbi:hypothetical protein QO002_005348 [Pararhizobium capsulatum DSM 1112]|uniref:Transposase n=1 Tax=Pararhizobium capsulatum DSM 1112 TaxID=1121113 RepID=A0ABU0BY04_9HYPH|nr:hypothetical protein [Pararhizobium capsulatum]MDQ0323142.1 hypothetical protein [Pararhizobium capsulatum DSM 1112]
MTISILSTDVGKNSCSVVGIDDKRAVIVRRTMRRQTLIEFATRCRRVSLLWTRVAALTTLVGYSSL